MCECDPLFILLCGVAFGIRPKLNFDERCCINCKAMHNDSFTNNKRILQSITQLISNKERKLHVAHDQILEMLLVSNSYVLAKSQGSRVIEVIHFHRTYTLSTPKD